MRSKPKVQFHKTRAVKKLFLLVLALWVSEVMCFTPSSFPLRANTRPGFWFERRDGISLRTRKFQFAPSPEEHWYTTASIANSEYSAGYSRSARTCCCCTKTVIPALYTCASMSLVARASLLKSRPTDVLVLLSTAALACFNLGPTDAVRYSSAQRAVAKTITEPSRTRARRWRLAVWTKLVGQLISFLAMTVNTARHNSILSGAVTLMVANLAFLKLGGPVMHTIEGDLVPMPPKKLNTVLSIDAVLAVAALLAVIAPMPSFHRTLCTAVYAAGALVGGIEGLVVLGKNQ